VDVQRPVPASGLSEGLVGAVTNPSLDGEGEPVPPFDCASDVLIGGAVGPEEVGEGGSGTSAGFTGAGLEGREPVGDGGSGTSAGSTGAGLEGREPVGDGGSGTSAGSGVVG